MDTLGICVMLLLMVLTLPARRLDRIAALWVAV